MAHSSAPILVEQQNPPRRQDPVGTRKNILKVARREFAHYGLSGARVDEIARKTRTSKRMIYYYFGNKEGLYRQALETAYAKIRALEDSLELDGLEPITALARLTGKTFEHHQNNPDYIRMVMVENIHHGRILEQSNIIRDVNATAIENLEKLYQSGVSEGIFREGLAAIQLHWLISALSFFAVSNQSTFDLIFAKHLPENKFEQLHNQTIDTVLRYVLKPEVLISQHKIFAISGAYPG